MDIILHLGAHRTASTGFQRYMRANRAALSAAGLGFWGPRRTRAGLFSGVIAVPGPRGRDAQLARAGGRIALALGRASQSGIGQLVISDENMIGTPRRNLRHLSLYPDIGERMARFAHAFGGRIGRVSLTVRGHDTYWASLAAYCVARGARLPATAALGRLAATRRGWRGVITDLACALPARTPIEILLHETHAGAPHLALERMTGRAVPPVARAPHDRPNRAPDLPGLRQLLSERGEDPARLPGGDGRWQPFDTGQRAALAALYSDDLRWLRAGADGLATLTEDPGPATPPKAAPAGRTRKGRPNGTEDRRMA